MNIRQIFTFPFEKHLLSNMLHSLGSVLQGEVGVQILLIHVGAAVPGGQLVTFGGLHFSHLGPGEQQQIQSGSH